MGESVTLLRVYTYPLNFLLLILPRRGMQSGLSLAARKAFHFSQRNTRNAVKHVDY